MKLQHVISTKQFLDLKILNEIFSIAKELENRDGQNSLELTLKGKVLASLFYEPSTRTRFSFEAAMQKLGGSVISTESAPHFSSVTKGESLKDTIRSLNSYADLIVLRHNEEGSAKIASEVSEVPIINAGDGGTGEHPTQALLDIYTIWKEFHDIDGLSIALVGDLLYGRTIHSLVYLLSLYKVKVYFISPPELKIPEKYKTFLRQNGVYFEEYYTVSNLPADVDVLYVTRVQKERFASEEEYVKLKGSYVIDQTILGKLKKNSIIMHPLPRVDEIPEEIDSDKRAVYFKQVKNGLYIRMALLQMILA